MDHRACESAIQRLTTERDAALAAVAERDARIATLENQVSTLSAQLTTVLARLSDLEARLKQNSSNSSKPPSSDLGRTKRPPKPKGKKPGGQDGHEGKTFELFVADSVSETKVLSPEKCKRCASALGPDTANLAAPLIFQTVEIPPVAPVIIEYQRLERCCCTCGTHTRAPLPEGVGPSQFGPRLQALVATWAIKFHLSRRQIQALCHSLFGLAISVGAIQALIERTSAACEEPVAELAEAIRQSPVVNADETGHAHQGGGAKGKRHWLWVAATVFGALFVVAPDRGREGLAQLLGKDFTGIVGCDRWRPYESLYGDDRQLCWAHLGREGQGAVDRARVLLKSKDPAVVARGVALLAWGEAFLKLYGQMFRSWHRFKAGEWSRQGLRGAMVSHKVAFAHLFRQGTLLEDAKVARTCRDLLRQWRVLWTFVTVEGVEPTNNEAERSLRQPVLLRKKSMGTRSEKGKRAVANLLSVVETCRRQRRSVIDYFEAVIQSHRLRQRPPTLLPT